MFPPQMNPRYFGGERSSDVFPEEDLVYIMQGSGGRKNCAENQSDIYDIGGPHGRFVSLDPKKNNPICFSKFKAHLEGRNVSSASAWLALLLRTLRAILPGAGPSVYVYIYMCVYAAPTA